MALVKFTDGHMCDVSLLSTHLESLSFVYLDLYDRTLEPVAKWIFSLEEDTIITFLWMRKLS